MNVYGYCRISTAKQSIDRQVRNIKAEYPTAHIVQEAYTGTSIFRPECFHYIHLRSSLPLLSFDEQEVLALLYYLYELFPEELLSPG